MDMQNIVSTIGIVMCTLFPHFMKKLFLILLFFTGIFEVYAQGNDSIELNLVPLPDSTSIGTPAGNKTSKMIGPEGGMISSDDGKLELIFPAGALDIATEISIQPITSGIPNANKAYQFEPSGIRFQKPVQLIFRYSDEEAEVCPPDLKFMALQDHYGKWEYMNYEEWDSAANKLFGHISHFSAFVDGNEVELNVTSITLKVGQSYAFALNIVQPPVPVSDAGEDELAALPNTIDRGNRLSVWKVNNYSGGSTRHGTIAAIPGQPIKANYKAPSKLIADTIKVQLELNDVYVENITTRTARRGRMTRRVTHLSKLATFTCRVKLYDEFKVTVNHQIKVDGGEMADTSVFRLMVGIEDRVSISEIKNQLAKVHIRQTRCRAIHVNAATCVGLINVTGIRTSSLFPTPDGLVKVNVFFSPAPLVLPVINFPPCGSNLASPTTPLFASPNAFPIWLNFEAKNEKQLISLPTNTVVTRRPNPEDVIATIEPIRD